MIEETSDMQINQCDPENSTTKDVSQSETNEMKPTPKTRKKCGLWIRNIVLGLLALVILLFVVYLILPSPSKVVRSFFYALMDENYPKAYSLMAKDYLKNRGSLEEFTFDYNNAVRSGTRTKAVRVIEEKATSNPNQRIVVVEIDVLYHGSMVTSVGAYLCEKIPNEGWRIVGNVTTEYNKNQAQKLVPQEP